MYRTGSIGSCVPPALTTILPSREQSPPRPSAWRTAPSSGVGLDEAARAAVPAGQPPFRRARR